MPATLFEKVWDAAHRAHAAERADAAVHRPSPDPRSHDPAGVRHAARRGLTVAVPERTIATVDHIVPTRDQRRPFVDVMAEDMLSALERNCRDRRRFRLFDLQSGSQGIVHVIGPELGLTQPGMTIACGDSHTSTHGAFGAVAFGIGTSQVRDVLASQCLAMDPLEGPADQRQRPAGARRLREGRHPRDHPPPRRERRRRLRLRVRRRRHRGDVDGRADDDLQHVDRRRRARRLRQSGRRDDRLPARAALRAGRRRVRPGRGLVEVDRVGSGAPVRRRGRDRRAGHPADGDVGHQSRAVGLRRRAAAAAGGRRRGRTRVDCRSARVHGIRRRPADQGHADRRRVRRLLHQRAAVGPARSRAGRPRASRRAAREGAGRARVAGRPGCGGTRRAGPRVHRRRLRMARRRLLDVPGDEPGPARGPARSAPRRPTATSRDGRAARPAARC